MLQITPQMRVLVAIEPIDGRKGIDSLVHLCKEKLGEDPFSGCVFIFRCRSPKSIRIICYDGQGFWMAQKRLSEGRFRWWPAHEGPVSPLLAHQAQTLLAAGNPNVPAAPDWRPLKKVGFAKQVPPINLRMRGDGQAPSSQGEPGRT